MTFVSHRFGKQFHLQLRATEDSEEMKLPGNEIARISIKQLSRQFSEYKAREKLAMDLIKIFQFLILHGNIGCQQNPRIYFINSHQDGKRTEVFKWVYPYK